MPKFFAMTSRGLSPALFDELEGLGVRRGQQTATGVGFEGSWELCYRVNLWSRIATRVVMPVLDFPAYQGDDLYHNTQRHDFTKYITADQTLQVRAKVRESAIKDQRFVVMKIKDAIVDQFREKYGKRPSIDKENPDLKVIVRIVKNQVSLAIDTTGLSLSERGYRVKSVEAPMREHLAAALIQMSGWKGSMPLVDLMCGSGTLPIEAARMGLGLKPSLTRQFAFENHKNFQRAVWQKVKEESDQTVSLSESMRLKIFGFDASKQAIDAAMLNARRAQVPWVSFEQKNLKNALPPSPSEPSESETEPKGIVIVNPPYGERLLDLEEAKSLMKELGLVLKKEFRGWRLWLLSGDEELTKVLGLKAKRRIPVYNGPLECRFLEYEIR